MLLPLIKLWDEIMYMGKIKIDSFCFTKAKAIERDTKKKKKKKALRQMTSTAWAPAVGAAGQRGEAELLQEVGIVHDLSANGPSRE